MVQVRCIPTNQDDRIIISEFWIGFKDGDWVVLAYAEFQHMGRAPDDMGDPLDPVGFMDHRINIHLGFLKDLIQDDEMSEQMRNDMWHH